MKLLFDQNVSPELVELLSDLFPGSNHVYHLDLHEADDPVVWSHAREHGFIIVSKDADFSDLAILRGSPPKLLWLRIGNCRTADIERLIRANYRSIEQLADDEEHGILSLYART